MIAGAGKLIEVTIKESDISDFLQTRGLREQVSPSKAGRRRKEGWRELCSYMAAYMVAHFRDLPGVRAKDNGGGASNLRGSQGGRGSRSSGREVDH